MNTPTKEAYADLVTLAGDLLPCVDDFERLYVIADLLEERGSPLCGLIRRTAAVWESGSGLRRVDCQPGLRVWSRYKSIGWSRGVIESVGPKRVIVRLLRLRRPTQVGVRAWWDLRRRTAEKPPLPPEKGFPQPSFNVQLAGVLIGESDARAVAIRENLERRRAEEKRMNAAIRIKQDAASSHFQELPGQRRFAFDEELSYA